MTLEPTQLVATEHKGRRLWTRQPATVRISAVSVRPAAHYTRAWSASAESVPVSFRLAVLPVRVLALALLWATSSPQRLTLAVALSSAAAVVLLV